MLLTERVPGGLDVALDPLLDGEEIVLAVLEVLLDVLLVVVHERWLRSLAGLLWNGPRTDLDIGRDVVWAGIRVGGLEIQVLAASWRVVRVEGVHVDDLTSVCVHAAGSLTRLDVSPDHWCHVAAVVHEASVKVWSFIWVGAGDVGKATREWILLQTEGC